MLDRETRHRIDNARDILVGKVPDPKSQVEQITIALIYKFMNDMDRETQEQGGRRIFFAGEFEKYRWAKLMSPGMGGSEMLNLYAEAIEKMNENPGIPQLFRDIFKNAYLPYRDPETLRLFLKVINEFRYTDSERLGDAFEYLLSVLGSQGDAGQFRTPRHIIDFMVDIVAPKKDEVILDPACGTGGFLISSYNYIRNANAKDGKPGAALKLGERKRLAENISGYDISPDYVRLALANMYLHRFREPRIYEYDTLTSEDRWNETADVILANPPFMTPKGGIRPHSRFSIQSKRSEVLFVDYIAEHLSAKGRAAVVVPEGIIFQSGKAYKQLRKMLVESYLVAVVSLPAGVFNPYSGVKTSILFMDKSLAKKAGGILFVKVENDGYDLGAQRRPIDRNDLPEAARQVKAYFDAVKTGAVRDMENTTDSLVVGKGKVNESVGWDLSGDKYKEETVVLRSDWPMVALEDILGYEQPTKYVVSSIDYSDDYETPVLTAGKTFILGHTNEKDGVFPGEKLPVIIFDDFTTAIKFVDFPFKVKSSAMKILHVKENIADAQFVFYAMQNINFQRHERHRRYWISQYSKIPIPLPPLNIQREILAEINAYQKIIDGARQVVENYTPRIAINPAWPTVKLGGVCDIQKGTSITKKQTKAGDIPVVAGGQGPAYFHNASNREGDTVTVSGSGAYAGFVNFFSTPIFASDCSTVKAKPGTGETEFVYHMLKGMQEKIYALRKGMAQPHVYPKDLKRFKVPFPPLAVQRQITAEIKAEEKLIDANRTLIRAFEQKIKTKIAAVWGE